MPWQVQSAASASSSNIVALDVVTIPVMPNIDNDPTVTEFQREWERAIADIERTDLLAAWVEGQEVPRVQDPALDPALDPGDDGAEDGEIAAEDGLPTVIAGEITAAHIASADIARQQFVDRLAANTNWAPGHVADILDAVERTVAGVSFRMACEATEIAVRLAPTLSLTIAQTQIAAREVAAIAVEGKLS